jgi:hypothetical protein
MKILFHVSRSYNMRYEEYLIYTALSQKMDIMVSSYIMRRLLSETYLNCKETLRNSINSLIKKHIY